MVARGGTRGRQRLAYTVGAKRSGSKLVSTLDVVVIDNRYVAYRYSWKHGTFSQGQSHMTTDTVRDYPDTLGLSRRVLGWLRILNDLSAVAIGVALVVSFVAPEFLFRALGLLWPPSSAAAFAVRGIMVVGIAGAFVVHRVLTLLLQVVESVQTGDPFVLDNAERLRSIAWWMLGGELLHLVVGALARLASTPAQELDLDWNLSFTPWIAVLLLFVLARVFAHGARMREELEGTV
jgi:hypothetical protein